MLRGGRLLLAGFQVCEVLPGPSACVHTHTCTHTHKVKSKAALNQSFLTHKLQPYLSQRSTPEDQQRQGEGVKELA